VSERDDTALRRRVGRLVGIGIVLGAALLAVWVAVLTTRHPRTDDAYVRANVVGIAPHVSGPIVELHVADNEPVKEGQLLFVVDPRPYEATLARAQADLALATAEVEAQQAAIDAAKAGVDRRAAEAEYAADYRRRVEPLLRKKFVTADKVEEARSRERATQAALAEARHEEVRARKLLAQFGELNARRDAAQAAVDTAALDVGYCRVHAPFDGYVTNLNVSVGEYARQGQQVFALVDGRAWYVLANFRETYLESIRPGMHADVYLLPYPGRRFDGVVQGIGWALAPTYGTTVGVLPVVEPTLDWVRLAQRFQVRILLEPPDPDRPYRMGATAVVTIRGEAR
jgi:multidrug efflux system membrane fusion protein